MIRIKIKPITLKKALEKLQKELKKDKAYRESWKSTIAMSYIDNENWYKQKMKKKTLNRDDKQIIANLSAEYFLKLLCDDSLITEDKSVKRKK